MERGLLSEEDRAAWHDAQLGDFFQNGGYGSILVSYLPGALGYTREEDTLLNLSAAFEGGRLDVMTMRRYTPGDSTLSGLMLTPSVADADGAPMDAHYTLSATSGIFMKWDALLGTYVTVGTTAESDGETVVWSDQTPAADAKDPVVSIALTQAARGRRRLSDRGRRADDPLKKALSAGKTGERFTDSAQSALRRRRPAAGAPAS